jgi:hypothetical protein
MLISESTMNLFVLPRPTTILNNIVLLYASGLVVALLAAFILIGNFTSKKGGLSTSLISKVTL